MRAWQNFGAHLLLMFWNLKCNWHVWLQTLHKVTIAQCWGNPVYNAVNKYFINVPFNMLCLSWLHYAIVLHLLTGLLHVSTAAVRCCNHVNWFWQWALEHSFMNKIYIYVCTEYANSTVNDVLAHWKVCMYGILFPPIHVAHWWILWRG